MKKIFFLLLLTFCIPNGYGQTYKLSKKINITGDEGWDYLSVDEEAQHLFVSHGSVVNVVDLKTDKTIATIPDTKGVHGIAIANDLNKAFISNGKENSISIINLNTFELIEKVKIEGVKPDAILYDQFSHKVFAYNAKSNDATVLDANSNKIIKTIVLGGKPEFSVTNKKGLIYVNIEDKNEIKTINASTLEVVNTWSIAPGDEPSGLALDMETNRLFSVCSNNLMVILDAGNGKIIKTLPIGSGCDGVAFDAKRKLIFSSNGEGTITVVKEENASTFSVLETIKTQKGARTIALNKTTNQLYLPTAEFGAKPEPTTENPKPRPAILPNSFVVLVIESGIE
ncbi:YncE family protein [Flavobacterium psychrotolerans]|uniref:YVTN family beta-propeller domain-containing protein n=1 Tax=Flavobacterium psychrotolerans TaxID=2169410 RepID=A0A2U1JFP1_9FLAO|nr:YncE family protein [Flavobacterium psychrotolerans]PWA03952.1 YVTN family beta-propeller domain-containing protein [Flavobacterium psychrotolerans]